MLYPNRLQAALLFDRRIHDLEAIMRDFVRIEGMRSSVSFHLSENNPGLFYRLFDATEELMVTFEYVDRPTNSQVFQPALSSFYTGILTPDIRERTLVWREIAVIPGQFYIARPGLAAETVDAVRKALLVFETSAAGREFFSSTGQGGYRPVNADDRALLERALPETRRLLHAATPG